MTVDHSYLVYVHAGKHLDVGHTKVYGKEGSLGNCGTSTARSATASTQTQQCVPTGFHDIERPAVDGREMRIRTDTRKHLVVQRCPPFARQAVDSRCVIVRRQTTAVYDKLTQQP